MRGPTFEVENAIIVMTGAPVEKCYPEVEYIAYRRLLDCDELAGVISLDVKIERKN
jgi:hypothetical protein